MELTTQEEMKAHLMATSEEYRTLAERHAELDRRVTQLELLDRPNDQELTEEARLKKLKLHLKDQMNELLHQASPATVS